MRKQVAVVLAATLLSSACYTYREPRASELPRGRDVRVILTGAGQTALTPLVGPRVVSITGHLTSSADSAVTLAVSAIGKRDGTEDLWQGETVVVRRDYVEELQERSLSRGRTAAAGGALVALTGVLYAVLGGFSGSSAKPGGGPSGGR